MQVGKLITNFSYVKVKLHIAPIFAVKNKMYEAKE